MEFDYELDDRPPFWALLVFGVQWAAITIPIIIVLGRVAAAVTLNDPASQVVYLQKLFFITAGTLLVQVLLGHRLPVVAGPATLLLVGVTAGKGASTESIYFSIAVGGLLLAVLAASGALGILQKLFTSRVVAVVLLLLAFALAPTILRLLFTTDSAAPPLLRFLFPFTMLVLMFFLQKHLKGMWNSTLVFWSILVGSAAYLLISPDPLPAAGSLAGPVVSGFFEGLLLRPEFSPGTLLSFLVCYLALAINDIGSMQSMSELIHPPGFRERLRRGVTVTGLASVVSGFFGVIGPVNYSISPGVIVSTRCASRFTLVPAAILIGLLAFVPMVIGIIGSIPPVIIGCVLCYILTSQIAAGLMLALDCVEDPKVQYESALVIGFPLLLGTVVAFVPAPVLDTLPAVLRPILGNGFVVGVAAVLLMEHVIMRPDNRSS